VLVTERAHYCANEDAETPTIRPAGAHLTIGYDGEPCSPTVAEVWHPKAAPLVVVLTSDDELWVLHRDEWSSQV
jgi:hypothetical protein